MIGARRMVSAAGCAALLVLAQGTASAATFNVTTTADDYGSTPGTCSLREAVEAANLAGTFDGCSATNTGPDIINLPAAEYVLTRDGVDDDNELGDLDVLNEPLAILGQAPSGPTTIDGDADDADGTDDRVIQVHASVAAGPAEDFGATGLIIRDGTAATGFGGGISILGPLDGRATRRLGRGDDGWAEPGHLHGQPGDSGGRGRRDLRRERRVGARHQLDDQRQLRRRARRRRRRHRD